MEHSDWVRLVAHVRNEMHRYFPNCPPLDMTVKVVSPVGMVIVATPDEGATEMTFKQINADESDAEWLEFRTPTGRILTIPFMD